ncbi:chaperone protein EcpD [Pseudomonas grimontii]|jgi:chaperone protein EcpD|uniref:Chaperone protein EcpD n=1 Tax=Pseudomonas grimontii TaxID=129847 RepID=A0A1H1H833_9PSED|nr:molecular chaperone [Pseudomonas grimontii]TWR67181.1 molecular chaperone [Pseudomonas grimontii]SDR21246.1 chaperone protein EcpD [Pseudomonas grimontii]
MSRMLLRRLGMVGLLMVLQAPLVQGEIVIDRTRVIYPAKAREVTVNLTNDTDGPRLVQVWVDADNSEALPEDSDVPFTVTQPIFRMEAGSGRALRLLHQSSSQHKEDRESVYWLNVLAIRPTVEPSAQNNQVNLAFRTRVKLFLRPSQLKGAAADSGNALQWQLVTGDESTLHVNNPGDYHVTLSSIVVTLEGVEYQSEDPPMIAPRSKAIVAMPRLPHSGEGGATLRFTTLDDQGATQIHAAQLGHSR